MELSYERIMKLLLINVAKVLLMSTGCPSSPSPGCCLVSSYPFLSVINKVVQEDHQTMLNDSNANPDERFLLPQTNLLFTLICTANCVGGAGIYFLFKNKITKVNKDLPRTDF